MMPVDDIGVAIADVYADALLKLAVQSSAESSVEEELGDLVRYVNSDSAVERFITRTGDDDKRRDTIEKAFRGRASDLLVDFLQVLGNKERVDLLEQIHTQYVLALEARRNQIEATVTTATPLDEDGRRAILEALRQYTAKEPVVKEEVDPSIIGGLVVRVGDTKMDQSIAHRLKGYRSAILTRASHEIHSGRQYIQEV